MAGKKKIFVAEDNDATKEAVREYLEYKGKEQFEVETFSDGLELLQEIEDNCKMPYLIITDLNMPRMDGLELTKKIKLFFSPKIPVVIMTATPHLIPENHMADAVVAKPPNFAALYDLVCELTNY